MLLIKYKPIMQNITLSFSKLRLLPHNPDSFHEALAAKPFFLRDSVEILPTLYLNKNFCPFLLCYFHMFSSISFFFFSRRFTFPFLMLSVLDIFLSPEYCVIEIARVWRQNNWDNNSSSAAYEPCGFERVA